MVDSMSGTDGYAPSSATFPIVGVGASAGGLEAFRELLRNLDPLSEMALVFVQHLQPNSRSLLPEILSRETRMTVVSASDGTVVRPKHVYVIQPNTNLAVQDGRLALSPRGHGPELHMPIDYFYRSLAKDQGARAIAVLLSGGGTDGSLGIEEIKGSDGVVFVQSEHSAKHDMMPRSGIATGSADFVLSPAQIGRELTRMGSGLRETTSDLDFPVADDALHKIFVLLRRATSVDFGNYKRTTIKRRIHRRIHLKGVETVARYVALLGDSPSELHALFQDFLIRVTSFFRDPSVFEGLARTAFPAMIRDRAPGVPIRFWVAGCSTGEEVYSLAIVLLEFLGDMVSNTPIKILATDINESALERARAGLYVDNIALDVSAERLRRFFVKANGNYQISQSVRDLCVFSKHNLAKDPPFANLDLISCRNLLIYFDLPLQKRVIPFFHYALKPHGHLLLGTSETVGEYTNLFEIQNQEDKLYSKKVAIVKPGLDFGARHADTSDVDPMTDNALPHAELRSVDIQREAERVLLTRFVPPCVIIDVDSQILHFRGQVGRYLNPVTGTASLDLLKMVRGELLMAVRDAIEQAKATCVPVRVTAQIKERDQANSVAIEVVPLQPIAGSPAGFIVLFEDFMPVAVTRALSAEESANPDEIQTRDRELAALRNYLQSVIEENEATSEELKAASEEILSSNEELQSTNEELQTAKEEMQSTNEELTTVNDELTHRNRDLGRVNDDLINLLGGLDIPIIMVNRELVIRRYTPPAEKLFNLIASDVGRPISHLRPNLKLQDLSEIIGGVVQSLKPVELDVQDNGGRWYSMRIRPYITSENRIDGAAIAMVDIDLVKRGAEQLKASRDYANAIVETVWEPLVVLDRSLNFSRANAAFHRTFQTKDAELAGCSFWEIDNARWNRPELRTRLPALLQREEWLQDLEVETTGPGGTHVVFSLNAQRILWDGEQTQMLLVAIEDITERRRARQQAELLAKEREARADAETASRVKDEFLAMLAHELRNPLAPVRNTLYILRKRLADDAVARTAVEVSQRQVVHMARLLDDLLDVSRITRGRIQLRRELLELQSTMHNALAGCRERFDLNEQTVTVSLPEEPIFLDADPARMEQVFSNILHNAAKYTKRRGQIWINARAEAGFVVIRIRDDGVGIGSEMLPRVFDLFAQVDRSLDRSQGGLGIGLTLVRNLVSLHGGTVEAHSPGLHRGSEFVIRLPTIALRHGSHESDPPLDAVPAPPRRVLVVDDNDDAATTLQAALAIHGHQVETADDPQQALEMALDMKPDFILLDIGLPGMDGYTVAKHLREDPTLESTVIIAITGYGHEDDRQRSKDAGIDYHLVKPVDVVEVTRLLREARRRFERGVAN